MRMFIKQKKIKKNAKFIHENNHLLFTKSEDSKFFSMKLILHKSFGLFYVKFT